MHFTEEKCSGGKDTTSNAIVLLRAEMTWSEKLQLLLFTKLKKKKICYLIEVKCFLAHYDAFDGHVFFKKL